MTLFCVVQLDMLWAYGLYSNYRHFNDKNFDFLPLFTKQRYFLRILSTALHHLT